MTDTLPADPDTVRLAQEIARVTGKPVSLVLREAVEATAEAAGVGAPPRRHHTSMDEVRAILARVDALPIIDPRSADEIMGYDEFGMPR